MKAFFQTDESINNLIIRVMLGIVMFPHGAQKLLGWFGGYGLEGTLGFFTNQMGMPMIIAILVILGESLGALGLIAGFLTRFCAVGILFIMSLKNHLLPYLNVIHLSFSKLNHFFHRTIIMIYFSSTNLVSKV